MQVLPFWSGEQQDISVHIMGMGGYLCHHNHHIIIIIIIITIITIIKSLQWVWVGICVIRAAAGCGGVQTTAERFAMCCPPGHRTAHEAIAACTCNVLPTTPPRAVYEAIAACTCNVQSRCTAHLVASRLKLHERYHAQPLKPLRCL